MAEIRRCVEYNAKSGEWREYHELVGDPLLAAMAGNPNKVKIDLSPFNLRAAVKELHESGLDKIPSIKTTRAKKDYFHNESIRDEMEVGVHYLLAYNRYGDFLSFNHDCKNIMPVRCKVALSRMPTKTKAQMEKRERKCREFISIAYMDRVVLLSSGEVSYLGRAYVDP